MLKVKNLKKTRRHSTVILNKPLSHKSRTNGISPRENTASRIGHLPGTRAIVEARAKQFHP